MKMNLKSLSDSELLARTKVLATKEREIGLQVLWHLKEVSDRRLYSARGYSSLHDYAVKELKYSEPAASRRISAMKLLSEIPEIAPSLETGTLSLTTVCMAQGFFRREGAELGKNYSLEEKREILRSLVDKSKIESEKFFATLSPVSDLGPDRVRPLTENHTELRVVIDEDTLKKLEKLKRSLGSSKSFWLLWETS